MKLCVIFVIILIALTTADDRFFGKAHKNMFVHNFLTKIKSNARLEMVKSIAGELLLTRL